MRNQGEEMAKWLKEAVFLNRSALCKRAKIDRGNLDKYIQRGVIPEQHIKSIGEAIYNYGWKQKLDALITENNLPENKIKIESARHEEHEVFPIKTPTPAVRTNSEEIQNQIATYEQEIKCLGDSSLAKRRKVFLQGQIDKLKKQL
jgi:hypothetical protein